MSEFSKACRYQEWIRHLLRKSNLCSLVVPRLTYSSSSIVPCHIWQEHSSSSRTRMQGRRRAPFRCSYGKPWSTWPCEGSSSSWSSCGTSIGRIWISGGKQRIRHVSTKLDILEYLAIIPDELHALARVDWRPTEEAFFYPHFGSFPLCLLPFCLFTTCGNGKRRKRKMKERISYNFNHLFLYGKVFSL